MKRICLICLVLFAIILCGCRGDVSSTDPSPTSGATQSPTTDAGTPTDPVGNEGTKPSFGGDIDFETPIDVDDSWQNNDDATEPTSPSATTDPTDPAETTDPVVEVTEPEENNGNSEKPNTGNGSSGPIELPMIPG